MANEIRVRSDFVAGGLSAGMITSDTAMNSAGLADLPAIAGTQMAALTLWRTDVLGRVTQKEVVYVTAHGAGTTTATVTRGREGTTAQTWLTGDRWSLTTVVSDLIVICTSSTRPATPYYGQHIYETDTLKEYTYTSTGWQPPNYAQYRTAQAVVGADEAPVSANTKLLVLGAPAANHELAFKKTGVAAAGNIQYGFSHRADNVSFLMYGWDGTTFKNYLSFNYAEAMTRLEGNGLNAATLPIYLYAWNDANHKIMYKNNPGGGSGDGPWITGYNKGHLGTCVGGEQWQFAWDSAGTCTSRGQMNTSVINNNGSINTGLGRGYTQQRFWWMGDGNAISVNWTGTFQMWVDSTNVKNFVIGHPKDSEKYLIHACLEGPEAGVYYRGQDQLDGGWVCIDLPDYFEALCAEEGRSVQLTCIADDPMDEWCPVLHATYPRNGKFYVGLGSGMVINDQRFWWEVKAVRKDVAPVNVEPLRSAVEVLGSGPYTYYKEK